MPPTDPTAFVFDLDGVLVDTTELVRRGWVRFAAARGVSIDEDDLRERLFGRRTEDALVDVFGYSPSEAAELAVAGIDDKSAEVAAGAPLVEVPGAVAFVRACRPSGFRPALVSSASAANVALALHALGLQGVGPSRCRSTPQLCDGASPRRTPT